MIGIYKITSPTGRVYIGQSKNIGSRELNYKNISKIRRQPLIERSILKYGWKAHTFETIEECSIEDLNCRERHWQDFYDVLNGGLNCVLQVCGEKRATRWNSMEVYDTFYFESYTSIGEAAEKTGVCKAQLKNKLFGRVFNNTSFVYKKDWDNNVFAEKRKHKSNRKVYDTETFQTFSNVNLAAEIYNIPQSTLSDYLTGKVPNPTKLEFLEDMPTKAIDLGKKVRDKKTGDIYTSISECSRLTGVNISTIRWGLKNNSSDLELIQNKKP